MTKRRVKVPGLQTTAVRLSGQVTPEIVQLVAEKVYAMWQRDLEIERERQRPSGLCSTHWREKR